MNFKSTFLLLLITIGLTRPLHSQLTTLHEFVGDDGSSPYCTLFSFSDYLYGTTGQGGAEDDGTVFRVKPDGTGFEVLVEFNLANGRTPLSALITDGTFLYGTTDRGGDENAGTIFKLMPDGSGFETIYSFPNDPEGLWAGGSLVWDGTYLYGMTSRGGVNYHGIIFKIMPDGTGYQKLHDFNEPDGKYPNGSLIIIDGYLYGMTEMGGVADYGVIFRIGVDGSDYEVLMEFEGLSNGGYPKAEFIFLDDYLYGTTYVGGVNDKGTMFKIKPDGSDYVKLYEFALPTGRAPKCNLLLVGDYFYGFTEYGGEEDDGAIFKIHPDGSGYQMLYDFYVYDDGAYPQASPITDGTFFYGTLNQGGEGVLGGLVFKFFDNSTNSVDDPSSKQVLTVYPNPFTSQTTLQSSVRMKNATVTIYNVYGQQVKQLNNVSGNSIVVDRTGLAEGVYFLEVREENKVKWVEKVVVE